MNAVLAVLALTVGVAEALPDANGKTLVLGHCSGCHSLALVTAQRGNQRFWRGTIRWMQEKHNLWPIPAEQEKDIVEYLAEHFADEEWGRRPALPPALLPQ